VRRRLLVLGVLGAFLVFGSAAALAADQPASPPAQADEAVGCGGRAPAEEAPAVDAPSASMMGMMMGGNMMGMMMGGGMMGDAAEACGASAEGWFIAALRDTDPAKLKAALGKLDADPEAKDLLATGEAGTIRKIIETGKLPDLSLKGFHDLSVSPNTVRLMRAIYGLLAVQRTLTT
jgi:hypothetical protein